MKKSIPIFLIIIALILFTVLTINVLNGNMDMWNTSVYEQVASWTNPMLTSFMIIIDFVGKWYVYLAIALLLLVIPKSRKKIGIPITFAIVVGAGLTHVLKQSFAIPRPDFYWLVSASGYGHPSGHITYGTAFIGTCVFLVLFYANNRLLKIGVLVLSILFMLLMGFNRIYLGVHTPTDVVAGYLAGTFVITFSIFVLRKFGLVKIR